MALYIDPILVWPHARGRYKAGSAHLCVDTATPLAELHAFAARCGFKRSWYHATRRFPHYDLVAADRDAAIAAGAIPVDSRELVERCRRPLQQKRTRPIRTPT